MSYYIQAVGFANGAPCPHAGQYLQAFDFEYNNGTGFGSFTPEVEKAMRFDTAAEAMIFWRTQSRTRPVRPDGRPNRPLTALSIEVGSEKSCRVHAMKGSAST